MSLDSINKDIAKKIASYLDRGFFSLSSINRKFRGFFAQERKKALGTVKIMVKENLSWSLLHTFDGKLYACGYNSTHLLDLFYDHEERRRWTRIGPGDKKIDEVVCGKNMNNFFVRSEDKWYGVGIDFSSGETTTYGEGSTTEYKIMYFKPLWGLENKKVLKITHNDGSFFIFCDDGFWYGCGENRDGRVDPNQTQEIIKKWTKIKPSSRRVLNIISTRYNTFVESEEGWYGCGRNEKGQLGIGVFSKREQWKKIGPPGKKVLTLNANERNTLVHCDDGCWCGCGENKNGQLATGDRNNRARWILLGPRTEVKKAWLCNKRIFIFSEKRLYTSGYSHYGQLFQQNQEDDLSFTYIGFKNKHILNVIGHSQETYVQCLDGWYAKGKNNYGQLGVTGEQTSEWIKLTCEGKNIQQLVPGTDHVFACTQDAWYVAGSNERGENGMGEWRRQCSTWLKVISHNQTMEDVLFFLSNKKHKASKAERRKDFRDALKKLYDPNVVKEISRALKLSMNLWSQVTLCMYYNENEPHFSETFYFSFPPGQPVSDSYFDRHQKGKEECVERIAQLLEYEYNDGVQFVVSDREKNELPPGSFFVVIPTENHNTFLDFLKAYEVALDKHMSFEQKSDENQLNSYEAEQKKCKI